MLHHKRYGGSSIASDAERASEIAGLERERPRPVAPPQPTPREMWAQLNHGRVTDPTQVRTGEDIGMQTHSRDGYARRMR